MGDPALSGDAVASPALLHKQWLGDLDDQPVRVEQIGTGESNAVIGQVGAACQVYPLREPDLSNSSRDHLRSPAGG